VLNILQSVLDEFRRGRTWRSITIAIEYAPQDTGHATVRAIFRTYNVRTGINTFPNVFPFKNDIAIFIHDHVVKNLYDATN